METLKYFWPISDENTKAKSSAWWIKSFCRAHLHHISWLAVCCFRTVVFFSLYYICLEHHQRTLMYEPCPALGGPQKMNSVVSCNFFSNDFFVCFFVILVLYLYIMAADTVSLWIVYVCYLCFFLTFDFFFYLFTCLPIFFSKEK